MGQKVHPTGIRLGITEDWASTWYAENDYADNLLADLKVRDFLEGKLASAGVGKINIERPAKNLRVTVHSARPGVIIGQKGKGTEVLKGELEKIAGVPVHLKIVEIRKPEIVAKLIGEGVAKQLEQRIMFRRAMKRAVSNAMRAGALGVKICASGRLAGAEIARSESYREGRVPLHTFRADIDYALSEAHTTYGVIGVKVWVFKGEKFGDDGQSSTTGSKGGKGDSKKKGGK